MSKTYISDSYKKTNGVDLVVEVANLQASQYSGVKTYSTLAGLPAIGIVETSYKVTNDPTNANNGYYTWNGSIYVKELNPNLAQTVVSTNTADPVSGKAVYDITEKERTVLSKQLIDTADLVFESILHNSDTISVSAQARSTNFIKVNPNTTYYFVQPAGFRHGIIEFTGKNNATSLGRVTLSASTFGAYKFVTRATSAYLKIGLTGSGETYNFANYANFGIAEGDWLKTSELVYSGFYSNDSLFTFPFTSKTGTLNKISKKTASSTNLLDYSKILIDTRPNSALNSLEAVSGASVSDYIECSANDQITMAGVRDSFFRRVLFYDVNNVVLSGLEINPVSSIYPGSTLALDKHWKITVPNNVNIVKLRLQIHSSQPSYDDFSSQIHIYKGHFYKPFTTYKSTQILDGVKFNPIQSEVEQIISVSNRRVIDFSTKTILFIGDSITSNSLWRTEFLKTIRPKVSYNYSAGGRRLVSVSGVVNPASYANSGCDTAHEVAAAITALTIEAPSYVFICLGANEFDKTPNTSVLEANIDNEFTSGGTTLKSLSSVDITKCTGALRYIVQTIGEVSQNTIFFICTPIPNTLTTWNSQKEIVNTIKWTAQRMSVPVIDLHGSSNIVPLWDYPAGTPTFRNLTDGVHPFDVTGNIQTPAISKMAMLTAKELINYLTKTI